MNKNMFSLSTRVPNKKFLIISNIKKLTATKMLNGRYYLILKSIPWFTYRANFNIIFNLLRFYWAFYLFSFVVAIKKDKYPLRGHPSKTSNQKTDHFTPPPVQNRPLGRDLPPPPMDARIVSNVKTSETQSILRSGLLWKGGCRT